MAFYVRLSALLVAVMYLGGCSAFGGEEADVDLHRGIATGIRVGERLYEPESTLQGCQQFHGQDGERFLCTSGPHAGLVIYMAEDVRTSKVKSIEITPDFEGTIAEGVGIGSSGEEVLEALGTHGCGSPNSPTSLFVLGDYSASLWFDQDDRVRSITLLKGVTVCAF